MSNGASSDRPQVIPWAGVVLHVVAAVILVVEKTGGVPEWLRLLCLADLATVVILHIVTNLILLPCRVLLTLSAPDEVDRLDALVPSDLDLSPRMRILSVTWRLVVACLLLASGWSGAAAVFALTIGVGELQIIGVDRFRRAA